MKTACLVNNYNYQRYLGDCIDSAVRQSMPFDEIIVVDDGSTDGSLELLARRYGKNPRIQIVAKRNAGQLSCFNEGFAHSSADLVFFLDADDIYEPDYLETAMRMYQREPGIDFLFCGHRLFGRRDGVELRYPEDRDLGYSVILTAYMCEWIGAPTSCLSMRRHVLDQILPLPFLDAWRTRADDCLVFGASLAGARKYFLAQPLVRYRVHANNQFFGRKCDEHAKFRRRLAMNALFQHLEAKFCYDERRFGEFHHREFRTLTNPTLRQLLKYCTISRRARLSLSQRLKSYTALTGHYLRSKLHAQPEITAVKIEPPTIAATTHPARPVKQLNAA
jgi:glycosyltransferase involved in cell wall biosynthesis